VIDDVIDASGSSFAFSSTSDIGGDWQTVQPWAVNREVVVRRGKDSRGFEGDCITVSGCKTQPGASLSEDENGIYLRQPPLDDIASTSRVLKCSRMEL
jgi:hypothetical protein